MSRGPGPRFTCICCGYPYMDDVPDNWNICPCCGIEFLYDEPEKYRAEWLAGGMAWWSDHEPDDWPERFTAHRTGTQEKAE